MPATPGQDPMLGPYILLERLGEGGSSQVFKARHHLSGEIVSLKVLRGGRRVRVEAADGLRRELQAGALLEHPNILQTYDVVQDGTMHFLVMEYAEGKDLDRLVQEHGPLPVGLACDYALQAALGLQHAHECGLVHRDVKPANLLLIRPPEQQDRAGGPPVPHDFVVKVLDMGIARLGGITASPDGASAAPPGGEPARAEVAMGTPDYIAPEQVFDLPNVDVRADVYSLGCTLYFLLTGRPPFPCGTTEEKLLQHRQSEPTAVEQLRPDLPSAVAAVVRRMMAKRPEDRYPTPAAVAEALAPFAQPGGCDGSFLLVLEDEDLSSLNPAQATVRLPAKP